MMFDIKVNWWTILACGVVYMAIGMLWYGPLFGREWMKLSQLTKKDLEKYKKGGRMAKTYTVSFLSSLFMAYTLSLVMQLTGVQMISESLWLAFWVWLGFVAMTFITTVLYEGKPFKLYTLNVGYQLTALAAFAVILSLWG